MTPNKNSLSSLKQTARKTVFNKGCYLPLVFSAVLTSTVQYFFYILPDVVPTYGYTGYAAVSAVLMIIGTAITLPLSFGLMKYLVSVLKGNDPAPSVMLFYYRSASDIFSVISCGIRYLAKYFLTVLITASLIGVAVLFEVIALNSWEDIIFTPYVAGLLLAVCLYYSVRWGLELSLTSVMLADGMSVSQSKNMASELIKGKTTGYIKLLLSFTAAILLLPLITFGFASYIYVLPVFTVARSIYAIKIYIDSGDGCTNG